MITQKTRILLCCCIQILIVSLSARVSAEKLDVSQTNITVIDVSKTERAPQRYASRLIDGYGAEPYPVAANFWTTRSALMPDKPAAVVFDYGKPVKVAALAHYFYVPGCRDLTMDNEWLLGPSAFGEVNIYISQDNQEWTKVSHHDQLPSECPQLIVIQNPPQARYLKLEVLSLSPPAASLRSYEIVTYVDKVPDELVDNPQVGKAISHNFPNKAAIQPAGEGRIGTWKLHSPDKMDITLPVSADGSFVAGWSRIEINDIPVSGDSFDSKGKYVGHNEVGAIEMELQFVQAGLLAKFHWNGSTSPPYPNLKIVAGLQESPSEWCIPGYTL